MSDKPKSLWTRPWKGPVEVLGWFLMLAFAAFTIIVGVSLASSRPFTSEDWLVSAISAAGIAFGATLIILCIRWLCCWKNVRRVLFCLACLATLIALFYAEEDWRGKHAWETFKHEWEAKGETFDYAKVVPPAVPAVQNFALTPIVASSYATYFDETGRVLSPQNTNIVNRMRMALTRDNNEPTNGIGNWQKSTFSNLKVWQEYYRALAAKTNEFPVPPQPQSPAADVLLALSKHDPDIEELRQASQLPGSRFPLSYNADNPAAILLPHLSALKACARVLQLRAIAELQNGKSEKALADVNLTMRLVASVRGEPFLISHLVRIAVINIALQPVWEGLAEHQWSDAQLVELDQELAKLDFIADCKLAMRGEMVFQAGMFDYLRHHPEALPDLGGGEESSTPLPGPAVSALVPKGWFYQNQFHCARTMMEFYLPAANVNQGIISPALANQGDTAIAAETKHPNPYNFLERLFLPALGASVKKFARGQALVDLARTACAMERYRLVHGNYPESLDPLAPRFIAKLPHDVINGQPLHYRLTGDAQFVLYSIGWNETEDGGTVVLDKGSSPGVDASQGDWVWQYPAR